MLFRFSQFPDFSFRLFSLFRFRRFRHFRFSRRGFRLSRPSPAHRRRCGTGTGLRCSFVRGIVLGRWWGVGKGLFGLAPVGAVSVARGRSLARPPCGVRIRLCSRFGRWVGSVGSVVFGLGRCVFGHVSRFAETGFSGCLKRRENPVSGVGRSAPETCPAVKPFPAVAGRVRWLVRCPGFLSYLLTYDRSSDQSRVPGLPGFRRKTTTGRVGGQAPAGLGVEGNGWARALLLFSLFSLFLLFSAIKAN